MIEAADDDPDRADFESLLTPFANLPPRNDDSADSVACAIATRRRTSGGWCV